MNDNMKDSTIASKDDFAKLTEEEKFELANIIEDDTLWYVNKNCKKVEFKETFYTKFVKRFLDIVLALPAVIVTLPINIIICIITYFDVGSPVIFYQKRIGKDGEIFKFGKFRSMTNETDENGILLPAYDRVTRWGRFVRKTSLDELLNFWYILIGKMTIIGPRPMPEEYLHRFNDTHLCRHMVKPGLECPLHSDEYVGGMNWQNRFDNDVWYVKNISFKTDIIMCWLLVRDVLFSSRREERSKAEIGTFIGYSLDGKAIDSYQIPQKYYDLIYKERNE